MNNREITIVYRDEEEETCYVSDYGISEGCLRLHQRYQETRYIPLDLIKEWRVSA